MNLESVMKERRALLDNIGNLAQKHNNLLNNEKAFNAKVEKLEHKISELE